MGRSTMLRRGHFRHRSVLAHFTGIGRRADAPTRLAQYRAPDVELGPVDAVNGAFMLMRRSALDKVGASSARAFGCTWRSSPLDVRHPDAWFVPDGPTRLGEPIAEVEVLQCGDQRSEGLERQPYLLAARGGGSP